MGEADDQQVNIPVLNYTAMQRRSGDNAAH